VVLVGLEYRFHQHSKTQHLLLNQDLLVVEGLVLRVILMVLRSFFFLVVVVVVQINQITQMGMMVEHLIVQLLMQQMQMLRLPVAEEAVIQPEIQPQLYKIPEVEVEVEVELDLPLRPPPMALLVVPVS
jgi:hypothetical protein